jgi:excisionase family DNA binding protein
MRSSDRWLSVSEAVAVLGRSASGIRGLIREGKLIAVQHVEGGKYQIRLSECERYLNDIGASLEAAA